MSTQSAFRFLFRQTVLPVLLILLFCSQAKAAFPDKPITLVVPYPAGGATDTVARKLQEPLSRLLGQTVLIDNKPGAGTAIGATAVSKAAADGYTLLISSNTTFTVNPALKNNLQYDAQKNFEGIGTVGTSPLVLIANPTLPANDVKELVALAKRAWQAVLWLLR